jgi:hypothetical protein
LKLRIFVYPNPLRQRGIAFRGLRRVAGNPSLTLRVVINPGVSPQVNNLSAETRNFKTRQRGIYGNTSKTLQLDPSLTFRVVMAAKSQLQNLLVRFPEHQLIPRSLSRHCTSEIRML